MDISIKDVNPYFRYATIGNFNPHSTEVCAFDYRLVYFLSGPHRAIINNNEHIINENCLIIIPPGTKYRFYKESPSANIIIFNFDYTNNHIDIKNSMWPKNYKSFEKNKIIERCNFLDCPILNDYLIIDEANFVLNELQEICKERIEKKAFYMENSSALFKNVIIEIIRQQSLKNHKGDFVIDAIIKYIHKNYNKDINNRVLGQLVGYHPYYVNRIMINKTGITLRQYLINYRLYVSKKYLVETDYSVNEIADLCGFKTASYFSTAFKEKNGLSPHDYRKKKSIFI